VTRLANALGYVALVLLVVQLLAPARGRLSKRPFRMTLLLRLHGPFGNAALAFAVAHLLVLVVDSPERLELLNVAKAPTRARDAVGALIALGVLAIVAAQRSPGRQTRPWRTWHVLLSTAALSLALGHVAGVGGYFGLDALSGVALSFVPLIALAAVYLRPERRQYR
jgi:predicted ferric reductase